MHLSRTKRAWAFWALIVLGLYNGCAGHVECRESGKWLDAGGWTIGPTLAVRALRALGTDDGDLQRYHAYANAVLGLPYQATFIRPIEGWKVDTRAVDDARDGADPETVPPVVPAKPLVPYRDFLVEYPPGFFFFAIPVALVARSIDGYADAFSIFMGLLLTAALALAWDVAKRLTPGREGGAERRASLISFSAMCALAVGPIIVRRYDAVISFAICLLVWGCVSKRAWAAGLGFGIGVAAKGMPLLLGPVVLGYLLVAGRRREAVTATLVAIGVVAVAVVPFLGPAGGHLLDIFAYHGQRPLQVESTGGSLLVFSRFFSPDSVVATQTYGSMNVVSAWAKPLEALASFLPLAAVVSVAALSIRDLARAPAADETARGQILVRGACTTLAFVMVLGKVFSPQYLTWLLPLGVLASLATDRRFARWTFLGALLLTQVIWPLCYSIKLAANLNPFFGALVLARNGLLFAWAWQLASPLRAQRATGALSTPSRSVASA